MLKPTKKKLFIFLFPLILTPKNILVASENPLKCIQKIIKLLYLNSTTTDAIEKILNENLDCLRESDDYIKEKAKKNSLIIIGKKLDKKSCDKVIEKIEGSNSLVLSDSIKKNIEKLFFDYKFYPAPIAKKNYGKNLIEKYSISFSIRAITFWIENNPQFNIAVADRAKKSLKKNEYNVVLSDLEEDLNLIIDHELRHIINYISQENNYLMPVNSLIYVHATSFGLGMNMGAYSAYSRFDEVTNHTKDLISLIKHLKSASTIGNRNTRVIFNELVELVKKFNLIDDTASVDMNGSASGKFYWEIRGRDGADFVYLKSPDLEPLKGNFMNIFGPFKDAEATMVIGLMQDLEKYSNENAITRYSHWEEILAVLKQFLDMSPGSMLLTKYDLGYKEGEPLNKQLKRGEKRFATLLESINIIREQLERLSSEGKKVRQNILYTSKAMIEYGTFLASIQNEIEAISSLAHADNQPSEILTKEASLLLKKITSFWITYFPPLYKDDVCRIAVDSMTNSPDLMQK